MASNSLTNKNNSNNDVVGPVPLIMLLLLVAAVTSVGGQTEFMMRGEKRVYCTADGNPPPEGAEMVGAAYADTSVVCGTDTITSAVAG